MFADYHIHTSFSPDSLYPMKDCIERAILLGIDEICFTEHIDYGCVNSYCCNCNEYYKTFLQYQEKYKNKISLKFGIEFGVQEHHKMYFSKIFEMYPFDFALLSFHQVEDKELWNQDFQFGKTQDEYYRIYYDEMLNTAQAFDGFSVLAHMDLLKRYEINGDYPFEKSKPQIEEIFEYIISHGKGIEVNTSSFRYGLNDLTPSKDILKLYKEMGGEIITIGSDSHRAEHLGAKIPYIKEVLKSMGYKYFTSFDKMKPIFHEL
ncbi:histidinol-phosphatase HisJ family protein [bacterium]|nr:histidinol-phosphatase HisJ family protein [bacterium]